jgi:hypothetical protein
MYVLTLNCSLLSLTLHSSSDTCNGYCAEPVSPVDEPFDPILDDDEDADDDDDVKWRTAAAEWEREDKLTTSRLLTVTRAVL